MRPCHPNDVTHCLDACIIDCSVLVRCTSLSLHDVGYLPPMRCQPNPQAANRPELIRRVTALLSLHSFHTT